MSGGGAPVTRQVNIYINNASAEKAMDSLKLKADKLQLSIDNGTKAGKDMTKQLEQLGQVKGKMQELGDVISGKITPQLLQVKTRVQELERELSKMSSDAPGYADKFKEFER